MSACPVCGKPWATCPHPSVVGPEYRGASISSDGKSRRGFASMDPEKQREIARMGGKAAHAPGGAAHEFTPEEARKAGKKGGYTVSRDRFHMAEIGRRGGQVSGVRRRANRGAT